MATAFRAAANPRLSAAMIVRNESSVLHDSLKSLFALADEIVVLDTGSTDQSARLAERLGARVLRDAWREDFAAARNRVVDEVRGEWILWIDAGERLTPDSVPLLQTFLERDADPNRVYQLTIEVPPAESGGSSQRALRTRLVPRRDDLRFAGRLREVVEYPAGMLPVETAPGLIVRHPREHDAQWKLARARRNLRLVELSQDGVGALPARLLLARGDALGDLGNDSAARVAFYDAMNRASPDSTELLEAYYGVLALSDGNPIQTSWKRFACLDALDAFPHDAQLLCVLGMCLQTQDQFGPAARAFQAAVTEGVIRRETWHLTEIRQIAAVALSVTLELHGEIDQARLALETSLEDFPQSHRIRQRLIDVCVRQGREDRAVGLTDGMPMADELRQAARDAVRGACAAAGARWTPALGYLQSAYVAGYQDPFCLRWLCVTLLAGGQVQAAGPVLDQWLQAEPQSAEARKYRQAIQSRDDSGTIRPGGGAETRRHRIDQPASTPGGIPAHPISNPADRTVS